MFQFSTFYNFTAVVSKFTCAVRSFHVFSKRREKAALCIDLTHSGHPASPRRPPPLSVVIGSLVAGNNVKTLLWTDYLVQSQCLIADATRTGSPVNVRLAV